MIEEPIWDWIKTGKKIVNQGILHHNRPSETRYIFNTPFSDVGEPYGDFFRSFFHEWQKTLIQPSISSTDGISNEGLYIHTKHYMYTISTREDKLFFGFNINSKGVLKGFYINGHHSEKNNRLNHFFSHIGEIAPNIEHMTIGSDYLDNIPNSWKNLSQIIDLDLRCPQLDSIPNDISKHWQQLLELYIINAHFKELSSSFCHFPCLTDLTLETSPNLQTLPPEIGQLTNLQRLSIINCPQFTHLPPEIGQLKHLLGINLIDLPEFIHIPAEIGQLSDFRGITLSHLPKLLEIPPEIGRCTQIRVIELDHLPLLRELPDVFNKCTQLHAVKIDGSVFLDSLPASLKNRILNMEYLYFHDKVIVPPEVKDTVQAVDARFVLSHDPLESLDQWIQKRGELGLDVESAQAFKAWFIENIPKRAYPWFGGLDGNQPTSYEQIQWLIAHPHIFTNDDLDWIDQQVAEWADHDRVETHTHEDWERYKRAHQTKKSTHIR